jgi:hypothetical protein
VMHFPVCDKQRQFHAAIISRGAKRRNAPSRGVLPVGGARVFPYNDSAGTLDDRQENKYYHPDAGR